MLMPPADEPYDVKLDLAAKSLAEYASAAWSGNVPEQARRAGNAVFARDVYGSRFLVAAPFGYGDPDGSAGLDVVDVDHWYAWDIDMCGLDVAAGAGGLRLGGRGAGGMAGSVGPSASGAVLAPCPEEMLPVLLDSCLEGSLPGMDGSEPRELIREYHRKQQRARALAWHDEFAVGESYDVDPDIDAFQAWYGARHPSEVPPDLAETADSIIQNWGPLECPDALTFYACSPHRIQYVAVLLRDSFIAEHANEALRLLPEWTQWCLSRNGVGEDSEWGGRALEAARAEAAALVEAYSRSRLT
jgi:hypothetical protein